MKWRTFPAALAAVALLTGLIGLPTSPASGVDFADLAGNFAGDQREEWFLYNAGTSPDYLISLSNGGVPGGPLTGEVYEHPAGGTYEPVSGNFDGDAYAEIFWHGRGPGLDTVWNFTSFSSRAPSRFYTVKGYYTPVAGDFIAGDGISEIVWYAPGPTRDFMWVFDSSGNYTSRELTINGTYQPVAGSFSDFNPDVLSGFDNIVWYAPGSAQDYMWVFDHFGNITTIELEIGGNYRPMVLDIWADGLEGEDIYWYAPGTARDFVWDFVGGDYTSRDDWQVNGSYQSTVAGAFLGGGYGDIVWLAEDAVNVWDFSPGGGHGPVRGVGRFIYNDVVFGAGTSRDAASTSSSEDLTSSRSQVLER